MAQPTRTTKRGGTGNRRFVLGASSLRLTAGALGTTAMYYAGRRAGLPMRRVVFVAGAVSGGAATAATAISAYVALKVVHPKRHSSSSALEQRWREREARQVVADRLHPEVPRTALPQTHMTGQRRELADQLGAYIDPERYDLPRPEAVSFRSKGNLLLTGYFFAAPQPLDSDGNPPADLQSAPALVLCHGFHGSCADLADVAEEYRDLGYNVLMFDFRGCGDSQGVTTSGGYHEVHDIMAAVAYVKGRPETDVRAIGVVGFSMGGATAIMAAAMCDDIHTLITDSAFANINAVVEVAFAHFFKRLRFAQISKPVFSSTLWFTQRFARMRISRLVPEKSMAAMTPRPVLIIHGDRDQVVPVEHAHRLYAAARGHKELWIAPNARHVRAGVLYHAEYGQRVSLFLETYLHSRVKA